MLSIGTCFLVYVVILHTFINLLSIVWYFFTRIYCLVFFSWNILSGFIIFSSQPLLIHPEDMTGDMSVVIQSIDLSFITSWLVIIVNGWSILDSGNNIPLGCAVHLRLCIPVEMESLSVNTCFTCRHA